MASDILGFLSILLAIFELDKLGAIQFILTWGANSEASDIVKPSKDALTGEIILWFGKPCFTATVEKRTIDDLFFF